MPPPLRASGSPCAASGALSVTGHPTARRRRLSGQAVANEAANQSDHRNSFAFLAFKKGAPSFELRAQVEGESEVEDLAAGDVHAPFAMHYRCRQGAANRACLGISSARQ